MFLGGIRNNKITDKHLLDKIANKLFYYPGFYEGIMEATTMFPFNDQQELDVAWKDIKRFLKYYQYIASAVSEDGICIEALFPFGTKEDIDLVQLIMINYLK